MISPLDILSTLGAVVDPVTRQPNLVDIKPFFDWVGTPLRNTILTMRLLNVAEEEEAATFCSKFPESVQKQKMVVEILIRSIWAFNGMPLCTKEQLENFNSNADTELTELDFKRMKVGTFEALVRDRLEATYYGLQQKQVRGLQGVVQCFVTGKLFPVKEIPEGSIRIRYTLAEIISKEAYDGLSDSEKKDVEELMKGTVPDDAENVPVDRGIKEAESKPAQMTLDGTFKCRYCGLPFLSEEDVLEHVEKACTKVGAPPPDETSFQRSEVRTTAG